MNFLIYHPASGSNAPSLVIGFCTVVVWTMPTRSYGRITGYDARFVSGSGSDLMVSKGRRELFHAVGDTELVTTDNVMVQVYKLKTLNPIMQLTFR